MQHVMYALSDRNKALIQESWEKVVPIAGLAADLFYENLFKRNPDIAGLFDGTDMGAQKSKLIHALSGVIGAIDQLEDMFPLLEDLGQRHTAYGVEPVHYDDVGHALLQTLEAGLGQHWNSALQAAWAELYGVVAGVMQGGGSAGLRQTA